MDFKVSEVQQPICDNNSEVQQAICDNDVATLRQLIAQGVSPHGRDCLRYTYIMDAAQLEALDCLHFLREAGCDVNEINAAGNTALSIAASYGKVQALRALLDMGVDVDHQNKAGLTPLMLAALGNHASCVEMLIRRGACVNMADYHGGTALMFAARHALTVSLQILLRNGAFVNLTSSLLSNALSVACRHGNLEAVKILLRHKINVNNMDIKGRSAVMDMAEIGKLDFVQVLVQAGCNLTIMDNNGDTALNLAAANGNENCVEYLVQSGANIHIVNPQTRESPVMAAARNGHIEVVRKLISLGANINAKDSHGRSALVMATSHCHFDCVKILMKNGAVMKGDGMDIVLFSLQTDEGDFVRNILQAGLSPNSQGVSGTTMLMVAAKHGREASLRRLLGAGADMNMTNDHGETALLLAVDKSQVESVGILLGAGADYCKEDNCGVTALMLAAGKMHPYCISQLIEIGAGVNVSSSTTSLTPLMSAAMFGSYEGLRQLIEAGAHVNAKSKSGMTALMLAAIGQCLRSLTVLITNGADLCEQDKAGRTALHWALRHRREDNALFIIDNMEGQLDIADEDGETPLVTSVRTDCFQSFQKLLKSGAAVHHRNAEGRTALMLACQAPNFSSTFPVTEGSGSIAPLFEPQQTVSEFVKDLLQADSDVNVQDRLGCTPLMYAALGYGYGHIVQQLLVAHADVNLTDCCGRTTLMYAAVRLRSRDLITQMSLTTSSQTLCPTNPVKELLAGSSPHINAVDNIGKSAVIYAALHGKYQCLRVLLTNKADPNLMDDRDSNALIYACSMKLSCSRTLGRREPNCGACAYLLRPITDNLNLQDTDGMTALMHATCRPLLADRTIRGLLSPINRNIVDKVGRTALVHALISSLPTDLLETFSKAIQLTKHGCSPVVPRRYLHVLEHSVSQLRDRPTVETLPVEDVVHIIVSNGILPLFDDESTLFLFAIKNEKLSLVKYLIASQCITSKDLYFMRWRNFRRSLTSEVRELLEELVSTPWPLSCLAAITVSSALGPSPGRASRIHQLGVDRHLEECLMFDRPVARFPVHHWDLIDLELDCVAYEHRPSPRPLLYQWPVGKHVSKTVCTSCGPTQLFDEN